MYFLYTLHSLLVCVFIRCHQFKNFLSFNAPYGVSNGSNHMFPFEYQLCTSCTCYIHFWFSFSGGATQFKNFLSFNTPYGGSNGSNHMFPFEYQLHTSCTCYIHFWFLFSGGAMQFKNFLSTLFMEGQMVQIICSLLNTNFVLPVHATFTSGFHFRGVPPNLKSSFFSTLVMDGHIIQIIHSHPNTNFLLPLHATFTSGFPILMSHHFLQLSFFLCFLYHVKYF